MSQIPCKGCNCGTTTNHHSAECQADHEMACDPDGRYAEEEPHSLPMLPEAVAELVPFDTGGQ